VREVLSLVSTDLGVLWNGSEGIPRAWKAAGPTGDDHGLPPGAASVARCWGATEARENERR